MQSRCFQWWSVPGGLFGGNLPETELIEMRANNCQEDVKMSLRAAMEEYKSKYPGGGMTALTAFLQKRNTWSYLAPGPQHREEWSQNKGHVPQRAFSGPWVRACLSVPQSFLSSAICACMGGTFLAMSVSVHKAKLHERVAEYLASGKC